MKNDLITMATFSGVRSWVNPGAYMRSWREKCAVEITDAERKEIVYFLKACKRVASENLKFRLSFKDAAPSTRAWFFEGIEREKNKLKEIEKTIALAMSAKTVLWRGYEITFK